MGALFLGQCLAPTYDEAGADLADAMARLHVPEVGPIVWRRGYDRRKPHRLLDGHISCRLLILKRHVVGRSLRMYKLQ